MRFPRTSISTLMAVVLVVAVNFAAGDIYLGASGDDWLDLLHFGARPMASILAIAALPARRAAAGQRGRLPFLAGFVVFGLAAVLVFIAVSGLFAHSIHQGFEQSLSRVVSPMTPLFPWSITAILVLPQLIVAVIGGRYCARRSFPA